MRTSSRKLRKMKATELLSWNFKRFAVMKMEEVSQHNYSNKEIRWVRHCFHHFFVIKDGIFKDTMWFLKIVFLLTSSFLALWFEIHGWLQTSIFCTISNSQKTQCRQTEISVLIRASTFWKKRKDGGKLSRATATISEFIVERKRESHFSSIFNLVTISFNNWLSINHF